MLLEGRQPSVLIVAAKWWALSARLAAALMRHRCRVSALCPAGHPLAHVHGLDQVGHYAGIRSLASLSRALSDGRPDIVVPCDDGVVAQLQALHRQTSSLRSLIERSLGSPESFSVVSSRHELLATALELGIPIPQTMRVASVDDLAVWHGTIADTGVLKIDGESGGNGVRISRSLDESLAAWRDLTAPQSLATAWKRLAIDRDPLALWNRKIGASRGITIQRFIHARPANTMFACRNGEVLSLVSVLVVAADGPTGAATIIQRIQDERMAQAAILLARRLRLTGFYGLDFMIETDTGIPYLIEMNPRCTQLGHLEFPDQGSLAGAFSASLRGESRPPADRPILLDTIALFPQALAAMEAIEQHRDTTYFDVPWDQVRLVKELKLEPRPQRQLASRLYHAVKPLNRTTPVLFQNPSVEEIACNVVNDFQLRAANDLEVDSEYSDITKNPAQIGAHD